MREQTIGANAAGTKTELFHYLKHQWGGVAWMLGIMAASLLLLCCHWACFAPVFLIELWVAWRLVTNIYRGNAGGTTNPAVITCVEPMTVAVLVDLSREVEPCLAVQISRVPDAFEGHARVGLRVPVVCTYSRAMGELANVRWESADPRPVAQITRDPEARERAAKMISDESWAELEDALKEIADATTPGQHLISTIYEVEENG